MMMMTIMMWSEGACSQKASRKWHKVLMMLIVTMEGQRGPAHRMSGRKGHILKGRQEQGRILELFFGS